MTVDDMEIVSTFRDRIAEKLGRDRYEVWFGPPTQIAVHDDSLVVAVHDRFIKDWVRTHFRADLEVACLEVFGRALRLEIHVDPSLTPAATKSTKTMAPGGKPKGAAPSLFPIEPEGAQSSERTPQRSAPTSNGPARRRFACLSSFVVGESNRMAYTSAQTAADEPGRFSPLFIHGPTGVGKTHLLEGIWTAFKKSHRNAPAIYLSAEQFTSYFLEALHGSGLPSFRRKYREVGLLIVDGLQFFSGKRATIGELVHTLDTLARAGRQLVLAADRAPPDLKALGPELATRLSGAVVCRLAPAEYATRLGIVRNLAAQLGVPLPADVEQYIAAQLTAQARELAGAIKRLHAMSQAHDRPITLALAEEALAELLDHARGVVRLADIQRAVCDAFGLEPDSLQSTQKGKAAAAPRMLAMWLSRKYTRAPLSQIGEYFGRRSHSTVISAHKKINSLVAKGSALEIAERAWKVEDAIRRVEDRLRAG